MEERRGERSRIEVVNRGTKLQTPPCRRGEQIDYCNEARERIVETEEE